MRTGLETTGTGLAEVFRMIASEPGFRSRKVGAP
jgi:hypothetical protein